jgi:hypothetical protein
VSGVSNHHLDEDHKGFEKQLFISSSVYDVAHEVAVASSIQGCESVAGRRKVRLCVHQAFCYALEAVCFLNLGSV